MIPILHLEGKYTVTVCTLYCAKHYTYIHVAQLSLPLLSCLKGFLLRDEVKNSREGLWGLEPKVRRN